MVALALLLVLAKPPAAGPREAPPDAGVTAPKRTVVHLSRVECIELAQHGFDVYLKDVAVDPGIQSEMEGMSAEERRDFLREVRTALANDRNQRVAEAALECVHKSERGQATAEMVACAKAAEHVPELEKCLGVRIGGDRLDGH